MKKVTIKDMIAASNIPASLVRAVVKQSGGWERFTETAEDITNHGVFRNDPIDVDDLARALYQDRGEDAETVQNVMAWYAVEEAARLYVDLSQE